MLFEERSATVLHCSWLALQYKNKIATETPQGGQASDGGCPDREAGATFGAEVFWSLILTWLDASTGSSVTISGCRRAVYRPLTHNPIGRKPLRRRCSRRRGSWTGPARPPCAAPPPWRGR